MSREKQGSLWCNPENGARRFDAPPLNLLSRLKAAMRQAAGQSRFSREEIVDRMNRQAEVEGILARRGRPISLAALDGWLAGSKNNLPDPELLALFCWAAENSGPVGVLAGSLEARLIDEDQGRVLDWAENELKIKHLCKRRRQLEPEK